MNGHLLAALVDLGVIDGDALLAGALTVTDRSHSNAVSLVEIDGRPGLVVKQAQSTFDTLDPFGAEAAAYRWLGASPATAALAPSLVADVDEHRALVLTALDGVVPLHVALHGSPAVVDRALAELGRGLAAVHTGPPARLSARRPWVLGVPAGALPAPLAGDEVVRAVAQRISEPGPLARAVEELGRRWTAYAPMHGDVKFDNVLVRPDGSRLWLVDWELAGLGEPAWDLGGVLDGLVRPRLVTAGDALGPDVAGPVETVLTAYRSAVGPASVPSAHELWLATVTRLAQSALQLAAMRHHDPGCTGQALQVVAGAAALAADPDRWSTFTTRMSRAA